MKLRCLNALATAVLAAALLAGCAAPPRPPGLLGAVQGTGDTTLANQLRAITDDAGPADARRVIFVGAALHSREDVFDNDVALLDATLRPLYGAAYRSVRLSNVRLYAGERALPLATIEHLDEVFDALAEHRRSSDRYIILLSAHGGPGVLELEQPARWQPAWRLLAKDKDKVGAWVRQLAPQPAWLVISACFAGSHLQQKLPPHLIAMAAAAADRNSFGCAYTERNTWFIDALVAALREGPAPGRSSMSEVWARTQALVAQREKESRLQPSLPDSRVGNRASQRFHSPVAEF